MKFAASLVVLAGLVVSQAAGAQMMGSGNADREGSWETRLGVVFQNSTDMTVKGGTTVDIKSGTGFRAGLAYHYTDKLEVGVNLGWDRMDYNAVLAGEAPGDTYGISGKFEYTSLGVDGTFNFLSGPFTPFVTGGIGWTWIDTNIATEPPQVGCWWTWYGYVCTSWQNTKTVDGFTYQLGAGLRYDVNRNFDIKASYQVSWIDLSDATGTPEIDGFLLSFGFKF